MPQAINLNKDVLLSLYYENDLTQAEIAQKLGFCRDTIRRYLKYHNIPLKSSQKRGQPPRILAMLSKAKELYYDQQLPLYEVSQKLNTSFVTIKKLLINNGLRLRTSSEAIRLAYQKHPKMGYQNGDNHPRYNGYRTYEVRGYVRVYKPDHPRARKNGYIGEHVLVWEDTHHAILPEGWHIHHLNGIKNDNRPENLVAMSDNTHRRVLSEKAHRIKLLEEKVRELEQCLRDSTRMNLE
jgi:hypothetical protein